MLDLYPPIEPYAFGHLPSREGHDVYFEVCGNPRGMPVVFLHGGPGSSCNPQHRRFFDPSAYRIILFDQRGCGRSRPRGEVEANATPHLIEDMERLRHHLEVERWLLFGGSWGSTLALAYAIQYPARVTAMILRGVFLASPLELQWYFVGLRHFVPEAWERFVEGISSPGRDSVLDYYLRELGADAAAASRAARRWNDYESAVMAIGETGGSGGSYEETAAIARVRVQLHYLINSCFLAVPLLTAVETISIQSIIVQGRRDLVCPPNTAYELQRALSGSELRMVEAGGHSAMHPAMISALVAATNSWRALEPVSPWGAQ